ncbi:ATP-binding protein [Nonomuraea sp. NPDC046802]|uniref:ATP-binding protein n=1 Tax=Nonomuraea sp. NPDC046802 TaxID=3154919 RepID=UPI0033F2514C
MRSTMEACWYLHAEPSAPAQARHKVLAQLQRWYPGLGSDAADGLLLVASELVTNSVVHAGEGKITVTLRIEGRHAYLEVQDGSTAEPRVREPAEGQENGWGLFLVETLSSAWGSTPLHDGKKVWALMPLAEDLNQPPRLPLLGALARKVRSARPRLRFCLLTVA